MSLNLITNPPTALVISTDWTNLVTRSNANMIGHGLSIPIFSLTNWDGSTTKPAIAEGSIIEVGGSFYQADADTALTDDAGLIDGTVHIKLVPAGGGASLVPTLTNDSIPAWDANKAGWYDSDDKFLPFEMVKATAVYTEKVEYISQQKKEVLRPASISGSWDFSAPGSQIIPKGKYYIFHINLPIDFSFIEIFTSGSWRPFSNGQFGLEASTRGDYIESDGVNMRVGYTTNDTTTRSVYYLAF